MKEGAIILIIDDEIQIRRLLRISLESHGYKVEEASSGKDGLVQVAMVRPDIIVLLTINNYLIQIAYQSNSQVCQLLNKNAYNVIIEASTGNL
jgi:DNA-binding response OmpR family regulator